MSSFDRNARTDLRQRRAFQRLSQEIGGVDGDTLAIGTDGTMSVQVSAPISSTPAGVGLNIGAGLALIGNDLAAAALDVSAAADDALDENDSSYTALAQRAFTLAGDAVRAGTAIHLRIGASFTEAAGTVSFRVQIGGVTVAEFTGMSGGSATTHAAAIDLVIVITATDATAGATFAFGTWACGTETGAIQTTGASIPLPAGTDAAVTMAALIDSGAAGDSFTAKAHAATGHLNP